MKTLPLILLLVGFQSFSQTVSHHGQLQVVGTQLQNAKGEDLTLRGASFGWHSFWPRFYNKGAVSWLATDFKATVVRAAMGIETGNGTYIQDPKFATQTIEAVIDGAIAADVYVIVDWHSHNINLKEAREFFDYISKKYGNKPHVIYEIFNEPDEETWPEVKAYSEEIIKVIRRNDPDNIILVGCPKWDQAIDLPAADPILGQTNLMYTMHFYAATHKKWLRDRTDAAIAKGLPVFVSESAGMEATGDGPLDPAEWKAFIDWMESRKISWVVWSVSDKDETCSMLQKSAASDGHWKTSDLKQSGVMLRDLLRKYHSGN